MLTQWPPPSALNSSFYLSNNPLDSIYGYPEDYLKGKMKNTKPKAVVTEFMPRLTTKRQVGHVDNFWVNYISPENLTTHPDRNKNMAKTCAFTSHAVQLRPINGNVIGWSIICMRSTSLVISFAFNCPLQYIELVFVLSLVSLNLQSFVNASAYHYNSITISSELGHFRSLWWIHRKPPW